MHRRHKTDCARDDGRCGCGVHRPMEVPRPGAQTESAPSTNQEAREFKRTLDAGGAARKPQKTATTLGDYGKPWLESYRGRTKRGLEDSSRREYEFSLRFDVDPLPIAGSSCGTSPPDAGLARRPRAKRVLTDDDPEGEGRDRGADGNRSRGRRIPFNPAVGVRYVPRPGAGKQALRAGAAPGSHRSRRGRGPRGAGRHVAAFFIVLVAGCGSASCSVDADHWPLAMTRTWRSSSRCTAASGAAQDPRQPRTGSVVGDDRRLPTDLRLAR